jgi:peptidyl-prolyl cis-trans isomerase B (cyclophilin B)
MKYTIILLALVIASCKSPSNESAIQEEIPEPIKVELTTTMGKMVLELSDRTPLHRDNFVKIVSEGRLDSMLFHRVLQDFVVQAGQYDSLTMASMDSLELAAIDYRVPAEIDTFLFHKRGALGAARTGNPERASASLSFYIVQRGSRADSLIDKDEKRINTWLQQHAFVNAPENKNWKDSLVQAEDSENWAQFSALMDTISSLAEAYPHNEYTIPESQREVYRTLGGTPHLDQNYTVFGEVLSGMEVVDSIAAVPVNNAGLPDEPVYILRAKLMED